ncbi:hypothetical protein ACOZ4L_02720 [Haloplanus ruber]|uniref:DUF3784 domain-containing protein n=1 Tax=Haloplanus ruber TaxID=869892 RepID=A0ABD6D0R0_9EURY|nr:hypothetical protein [Haloplanus ruber]
MIDQLPVADLRAIGATLLLLVVLYWTYERLAGEGRDPVIRSSMSSSTGSASMLVSGAKAVMLVSGLAAALLLAPVAGGPVVSDPTLLLATLGALLLVHWFVEKEERET